MSIQAGTARLIRAARDYSFPGESHRATRLAVEWRRS